MNPRTWQAAHAITVQRDLCCRSTLSAFKRGLRRYVSEILRCSPVRIPDRRPTNVLSCLCRWLQLNVSDKPHVASCPRYKPALCSVGGACLRADPGRAKTAKTFS